jgi:hypothetical protein
VVTNYHAFQSTDDGPWCSFIVNQATGDCCDWAPHARVHQDPALVERELSKGRPGSVAERLRAAAEKWARLDFAATWGPWSVHESWAGKCAVVTDGGHPIAIVSHGEPSDTAKADAELIARSRSFAPVIAKHLSGEADRFDSDTTQEAHYPRWHDENAPGCGRDIEPVDGTERCTCWDAALALADAILGPVTA